MKGCDLGLIMRGRQNQDLVACHVQYKALSSIFRLTWLEITWRGDLLSRWRLIGVFF